MRLSISDWFASVCVIVEDVTEICELEVGVVAVGAMRNKPRQSRCPVNRLISGRINFTMARSSVDRALGLSTMLRAMSAKMGI